jgi:hemolysin-activating ACP:hemolysin acyltransferase
MQHALTICTVQFLFLILDNLLYSGQYCCYKATHDHPFLQGLCCWAQEGMKERKKEEGRKNERKEGRKKE